MFTSLIGWMAVCDPQFVGWTKSGGEDATACSRGAQEPATREELAAALLVTTGDEAGITCRGDTDASALPCWYVRAAMELGVIGGCATGFCPSDLVTGGDLAEILGLPDDGDDLPATRAEAAATVEMYCE